MFREKNKEINVNNSSDKTVNVAFHNLISLVDEKNRLLKLACHDLKNSIIVIDGFSKILNDKIADCSINQVVDFTQDIKFATQSMIKVISDCEQIINFDTGKNDLQNDLINIEELLNCLVEKNSLHAASKGIKVHLQMLKPDLQFFNDYRMVELILQNLISNAITFSPLGKVVTIIANEYIPPSNSLKYAIFEIEDQGLGIPQNELNFLFNPYKKKSNRPTNDEVTTGLGLAVVQGAVELLSGSVCCRSEVGTGTVFSVFIPHAFEMSVSREKLNKQILSKLSKI